MNPSFLKDVQAAGWDIVTADEHHVWAACGRAGCNFQFKMKDGARIPSSCRPAPVVAEIIIQRFDDARLAIRDRREQLCLSIKDVEEASGLASDHVAKMEKDNPSRLPNIQTFLDLAATLGYEVVLRPVGLPDQTLRIMSDTRHQITKRKNSFSYFRRFRAERSAR